MTPETPPEGGLEAEEAPTAGPRPASWPAELPWVAGLRADFARVDAPPTGDRRLRAAIPAAPIAALAGPWRAAMADLGYVERGACDLDEAAASFTCDYLGAGRLAQLAIYGRPGEATGGYADLTLHLYPADHRPLAALPGPCVAPPARVRDLDVESSGIDQEGQYHRELRRWRLETGPLVDLDGDGVAEVSVPKERGGPCPWAVESEVYVTRGACGHRIGAVVGFVDDQTPIAPFAAGIREITTTATWADQSPAPTGADDREARAQTAKPADAGRIDAVPWHHERRRTYRFDGAELRLVADHDVVGRCHHCGVAECR